MILKFKKKKKKKKLTGNPSGGLKFDPKFLKIGFKRISLKNSVFMRFLKL